MRSLGLWLGLVLLAAAADQPVARIQDADTVDESSGLARASAEGLFWTHNDSGGDAAVYAMNRAGRILGTARVMGAVNKDWEDIAPDGQGGLWIADSGNNNNKRRDLRLYHVPEPQLSGGAVTVDEVVDFRYPEQTKFPDEDHKNFDSESLFVADGELFLLTKHRSDQRTVLYRIPRGEGQQQAQLLGDFELGGDPRNFGGMATGADLSADGQTLAVLTYHAIFLFSRPEGGDFWLSRPRARIDLDQGLTGQCEAISWDGDAILFTNEGGSIFRVDSPLAPGCTHFPSEECHG